MDESKPGTGVAIDNVLFATDFSAGTESAFSFAVRIAERYQAKLYLVHVINLESFDLLESESARSFIKEAHDLAGRKMTQLLDRLRVPRERYEAIVSEGAISEVLMDIIRLHHIDLAVLGTHGRRAFKKLLLGSIAEEVFRTAACPVLTVGPQTPQATATDGLRHILYPMEFAPDTSKAAQYAVSLAEQFTATLTVMNVRENMPAADSAAEEFPQPFKRWLNENVTHGSDLLNRIRFERGFGPAADALLDFVVKANVDLVVMSVRDLDPVMAAHVPTSNTTHQVVRRAPCPVLTIRR